MISSMIGVQTLLPLLALLPSFCQSQATNVPWSRIPNSRSSNFNSTDVLVGQMTVYKCALEAQTRLNTTEENGLGISDGNAFEYDSDTKICTLGKMTPFIDDYPNIRKETQAEDPTNKRIHVNRNWLTNGKQGCPVYVSMLYQP